MRKLQAIRFLQHQIIHGATLCCSHARGSLPPKNVPCSCISSYLLAADSVTSLPLSAAAAWGVVVLFSPTPLCILGQSAAFFKNAFVFLRFFFTQLKFVGLVNFTSSKFNTELFIFIMRKKLQIFFFQYFIHPVCINT